MGARTTPLLQRTATGSATGSRPREGPARAAPAAGRLRGAWLLSAIVVVLMAVASAAGLLISGLYQDPGSVSALLRGYDLVTLVVVVPVLAAALLGSRRGSQRAQLVWLSMLAYSVYNYAFYVFGSQFNDFFLVHVALFGLSIFALVLALANLDVTGIAGRFRQHTPVRWISAILLFLAVGLGAMWVVSSLRFAITGEPPTESRLVLPTAGTHLGYVLDLSLLVPGYALAAVLLWRRHAWGYVLATLLLTSGAVHQVSYMTALVFQANANLPGATSFDPGEPPIALGFLIAAALLLGNLRLATRRTR